MKKIFFMMFFLLLFLITNTFARNATIISFSPQGTVYPIKQVMARFSTVMVPLSEQTLESPFDIDCAYPGKGRWVDQQTYIYDFINYLPGGVSCAFTLKPSVKDYNGTPITGKKRFSFSTGGPVIVDASPYNGSHSIHEDQIFVLLLSAKPDVNSVKKHAYFKVDNLSEQVGISIVDNDTLQSIIEKSDSYQIGRLKDREKEINGNIMGIKARLHFPSGAKVSIVWDKGIATKSGIKTKSAQILSFKVRDAFMAKMRCTKTKARAGCLPITPIYVDFTASIYSKDAKKIKLVYGDKVINPIVSSDKEWVYSVKFDPPFKAKSVLTLIIPEYLKDIDGRQLSNAVRFPLNIEIDESPPLAKFSSTFGIIEAKDGILPLTVRNLNYANVDVKMGNMEDFKLEGKLEFIKPTISMHAEIEDKEIMKYWRILQEAQRGKRYSRKEPILHNNYKTLSIPISQERNTTEVVGIPLKEKGFYVVEIKSEVLGKTILDNATDMYVRTAALVTNMAVHFKKGGESSLVWVTTLDKAKPVKNAIIAIRRGCDGTLVWTGRTNSDGVAFINENLLNLSASCRCGEDGYLRGFFISARKGDDMSFVLSTWDDGIEPWRFNVKTSYYSYIYSECGNAYTYDEENTVEHTIFDRTLFKPGETVHMKHIIRKKTGGGFDLVRDYIPKEAVIRFSGSYEEVATIPVVFDENSGTATSEWKIPEEAKLGNYYVKLDTICGSHTSDGFRVEAFRVPLIKAHIEIPEKPLVAKRETAIGVFAQYLSGGPAVGIPVNLRWKDSPKHIYFPDYKDFDFEAGVVKEGIIKSEEDREGTHAQKIPLILDESGSARVTLSNIPYSEKAQNIDLELDYMDPNGEIQTVASKIDWWPSNTVIGIKKDAWVSSPSKVKFSVVALNINGKPKKDVRVKVDFLQKKILSHRKRLVGGFYSYEHYEKIVYMGKACEGLTDEKGYLHCESIAPISGNIILQAYAGSSATNTDVWVAGESDWWFKVENDDRMDLLPEKKRYEVGEKARFQVRMPFKKATVLVTVEREGILTYYIKKLSRKNPVFKIPVEGNYSPNVYVSALAVKGRVSDIKPTATIDLGKPAFKLGIAEIKVGFLAHELKVKVVPEKELYKVRDHARAKIKVNSFDGKPLSKNTAVTVAVVDEGLLQIYPNESWNILEAMMGERALNVMTSSASMYVVGKRHFGKKATPTGGGGGFSGARQVFDTLLLWQPNILLDKNGEADIEIPLNDSLTSFTIAAMAISGVDKFGKSTATIRTSKDIMLFSGLPPVVRVNDQFAAHFTVRNATKNTAKITLNIEVEGKKNNGEVFKQQIPSETLYIDAFKSAVTKAYFEVPSDINSLNWWVKAEDESGNIKDSLKVTEKVIPVSRQHVWQQSLHKITKPLTLPVSSPIHAIQDKSLIEVGLSKSLGGNIESILSYMDYYPYNCLEQLVSKAVVKNDESYWEKLTYKMYNYIDNNGLLKYFPEMVYGSDILTSYVLSIASEALFELYEGIEYRLLKGLSDFVEGKIDVPSLIDAPDYTLRKLSAIAALLKYKKAKPEMMDALSINPMLLPTSALLDYIEIIKGLKVKNQEKLLEQSLNILKSRIYYTGTRLGFSREKDDYIYHLMVSPDVNAARLLLLCLKFNIFAYDAGKIARGLIERQEFGYFDTTVANAWATVSLRKFRLQHEGVPITGMTVIKLGDDLKSVNWDTSKVFNSLQFKIEDKGVLSLSHKGKGAPWVTISSLATIPVTKPLYAGIAVNKTITPISQKLPNTYHVGDVMRITLQIKTESGVSWLVVNDPVSSGTTILGGIRSSIIREKGISPTDYYYPVYEEHAFDAYRAYYSYVPEGSFSVYYDVRFNQDGIFKLPSTRVEAIYAPEIFGEIPNETIKILP